VRDGALRSVANVVGTWPVSQLNRDGALTLGGERGLRITSSLYSCHHHPVSELHTESLTRPFG
jgi:hypothetical protein